MPEEKKKKQQPPKPEEPKKDISRPEEAGQEGRVNIEKESEEMEDEGEEPKP